MKQAIQEGFILDVLRHYTPVESYYKLIKKVEGDPELDRKKANRKLRRYVESHDHAIRLKTEIMVDHFHEQVLGLKKIGGQARAMVVTSGIERAIQYHHAIRDYLSERKSPYRGVVAFSGEHDFSHTDWGGKVSEASLTAFRRKRSPTRSGRTRTASSSARTSSRPATTSPCCTRSTWTSRSPASRPWPSWATDLSIAFARASASALCTWCQDRGRPPGLDGCAGRGVASLRPP